MSKKGDSNNKNYRQPVLRVNDNFETLKSIESFLLQEESVYKMELAEYGMPSVSFIADKLEQAFPQMADYRYRQYVGEIVSSIMKSKGYTMVSRYKIRNFSKSKYFITSAVYKKLK